MGNLVAQSRETCGFNSVCSGTNPIGQPNFHKAREVPFLLPSFELAPEDVNMEGRQKVLTNPVAAVYQR